MFMKKIYLVLFLLLLSLPLFAQPALPGGMQTLADNILAVFKSDFLKAILGIFLCGSAVAYAFNKDNEKVKRNCIAIGIATGILAVATQVIAAVWGAASS